MKKIILGLIATMGIATINAQTQQSDWMIGGSFRLNTSDNNTELTFTPNAGIFVIDNLAVGGNLGISYSKNGNNRNTTFSIGPFVRYYFTTQNQTIRPVLHGSLNYLSNKSKIGNNFSSTNTGTNYFIGGGAALFISNNVSIDALMGYDHTKYSDFNGSGGFAFNIGFQVYINKGQIKKVTGKKN